MYGPNGSHRSATMSFTHTPLHSKPAYHYRLFRSTATMSIQVVHPSIFDTNSPTTTQLLDKLFQFVHCHIFTYQLGAHDYIRDDRGIFINPDLAITLWTSAKLLAEGVNITPDVITYCHDQHFPLPSRLLTYNYARGPNPLLGAFNCQRDAIAAVKECQEEGKRAIQWIVSIVQELMQGREMNASELKMRNRDLIDYYKCLTWPGYDEHGNTCRALVPFRPPATPPTPYSPGDHLTLGRDACSPAQPAYGVTAVLPAAGPSSPAGSQTADRSASPSTDDLSDFAMPHYMNVDHVEAWKNGVLSPIEQGGGYSR